jgi:hypothetical protein
LWSKDRFCCRIRVGCEGRDRQSEHEPNSFATTAANSLIAFQHHHYSLFAHPHDSPWRSRFADYVPDGLISRLTNSAVRRQRKPRWRIVDAAPAFRKAGAHKLCFFSFEGWAIWQNQTEASPIRMAL